MVDSLNYQCIYKDDSQSYPWGHGFDWESSMYKDELESKLAPESVKAVKF